MKFRSGLCVDGDLYEEHVAWGWKNRNGLGLSVCDKSLWNVRPIFGTGPWLCQHSSGPLWRQPDVWMQCLSPDLLWRFSKVSLDLSCYMWVRWPLRWSTWWEAWSREGKLQLPESSQCYYQSRPLNNDLRFIDQCAVSYMEGIIQHTLSLHSEFGHLRTLDSGSHFHNLFVGNNLTPSQLTW